MSKEEQSAKTKKIITTSNDSLNKKEDVPVKTSQSMNTESYEYFSQRITTKNNITESSIQTSNQKVKNESLKCICNQGSNAKKELKELKCTCGLGLGQEKKCICGLSNKISGANQVKIKSTTINTSKYKSSSNEQKSLIERKKISLEVGANKCNCGLSGKSSIQKESKTSFTKIQIEKMRKLKEEWNKRIVGQNNENLQIIAAEKPELMIQCVQDINVIQEPRPVQILLPIVPNEIDYPLGLEIYGQEKKVAICPENVENLDVSKAYSTIKPKFENLDVGQSENIYCERAPKKEKGYDIPLNLENGEMFVKGQKDFNKNNEVELTTKMNVIGKQKLPWNETNEAIKTTKMNIDNKERTKFDNLYVENNLYKYQGKQKNRFSPEETNLEQNGDMTYPAEYVLQDWNASTKPMSGIPFTIEKAEKKEQLSKIKGEKINIKRAYDTVDWNKKNNKRKKRTFIKTKSSTSNNKRRRKKLE